MEKTFIIDIHSMTDLITNSSTELFIVDENKIEGTLKEVFVLASDSNNLGDESSVIKFDDYKYKNDYILTEEYENNTSSLYVFNISYDDAFLINAIEQLFNPIKLENK